jgi:hypothetical protein
VKTRSALSRQKNDLSKKEQQQPAENLLFIRMVPVQTFNAIWDP